MTNLKLTGVENGLVNGKLSMEYCQEFLRLEVIILKWEICNSTLIKSSKMSHAKMVQVQKKLLKLSRKWKTR